MADLWRPEFAMQMIILLLFIAIYMFHDHIND